MLYVTGEVQYLNDRNEGVHSDICFDATNFDRKFLHDLLDEFLDHMMDDPEEGHKYDDLPMNHIMLFLSEHDH